jgi:phosphopantothenoylcysteine decarboxylase/phosphopantothenate--cysteine ligase
VWTDLWDPRMGNNMAHIDLTRDADAILIAPATADVMAKLVHGLADDLLTTLCLARDCPLLVAPAMNRQMWEHPATRRNAAQLVADGVTCSGRLPASRPAARSAWGACSSRRLCEAVIGFFQPKLLAGRRVVMTAGPTFEPIDPVRGITNSSSGKMAYGLARACVQAGAEVVLVSGPVACRCRRARRVSVRAPSRCARRCWRRCPAATCSSAWRRWPTTARRPRRSTRSRNPAPSWRSP